MLFSRRLLTRCRFGNLKGFLKILQPGYFVSQKTRLLTSFAKTNILFNTILMKKPVQGTPVSYADYFSGNFKSHLTGIAGGIVWCIGMSFSIIASDKAGPAISYGLGQGAVLVAAIWGVFIWKEFKAAPKGTNSLLYVMFICFFLGLSLLVYSKI